MHYWTLTNYADFTFQAPYNKRAWTPGWITRHTIVFPRAGTPPPGQSDPSAPSDHLRALFLAVADRMADLAAGITRLERQAHAGRISPRHAAARLRRILAAVENSLQNLYEIPL